MKKILSLPLACVFLQTQCWALSGGPVYPVASVPESGETVIYGGAMIPRSGSNSMGVFFVSAPVGKVGTGQFNFFIEGELVTGEITGATDAKGNFSAVFQGATRESSEATVTTTTGSTQAGSTTTGSTQAGSTTTGSNQGSVSEGTQTVVGPVPIGTIVGSPNIPPLIVDGVIVTGDITTSITDVATTQNDNTQTGTTQNDNTQTGTTQNDSQITTTTTTPDGFVAGQFTAKIKNPQGNSSVTNPGTAAQLSGKGNLVLSTPSLRTQLKFKVQGSRQTAPAATPAATPAPAPQFATGGGGFGLP